LQIIDPFVVELPLQAAALADVEDLELVDEALAAQGIDVVDEEQGDKVDCLGQGAQPRF